MSTPTESFELMKTALATPSPGATVYPATIRADAARITAELLETCRTWVRRYIVVSDHQAIIIAAWIMHTYVVDAADFTPYIHITAPEKECGKSRLMETMEALAAAPIRSGGMSAPVLIRAVEAKSPTLFLDEMDAQLGANREFAEAIRGILNEGFRRGGVFHKCVGRDHEIKEFRVFCPKCFAGIGQLPDTVASRSIVIEMLRKLPEEQVEPFRQRAVKTAALPIKTELEAWAARGAADWLRAIEPVFIASLGDRQNDISEPLLAIAQLAGDGWLQRLTAALQIVFKAARTEDGSIDAILLADVRSVFDASAAEQIPSKALARKLCGIEGRPWADWARGTGLSPNNLAQQLKKFKIYPRGIRVGDKTPKGYRREDFEDAWARYCPILSISNATTPQPASSLGETGYSDRNIVPHVAVRESV
jgi:hypothetical protein